MKDYDSELQNPILFRGISFSESFSWYDCLVFIMELNEVTKLHFRLPQKKEWEHAACWGKNGRNEYGKCAAEEISEDYARGDMYSESEIAELMPNSLGVYGMYGAVWEWCQDMEAGTARVLRGDGRDYVAQDFSLSNRCYFLHDYGFCFFGFRLSFSSQKKQI